MQCRTERMTTSPSLYYMLTKYRHIFLSCASNFLCARCWFSHIHLTLSTESANIRSTPCRIDFQSSISNSLILSQKSMFRIVHTEYFMSLSTLSTSCASFSRYVDSSGVNVSRIPFSCFTFTSLWPAGELRLPQYPDRTFYLWLQYSWRRRRIFLLRPFSKSRPGHFPVDDRVRESLLRSVTGTLERTCVLISRCAPMSLVLLCTVDKLPGYLHCLLKACKTPAKDSSCPLQNL